MVNLSVENDNPDIFCSELSHEVGEPMAGTAVRVDAWFLLEYAGTWGAKATADNDLPWPVREWLNEQLALVGKGRLQFIKQSRPMDATGITLFVALSREFSPVLYHFRFHAYEDMLKLNGPAICSGDDAYDEFIRTEPLYLVCTNGKRDRCCARVGVTLFHALVAHVGDAVWQCTHLGGHRFAPTLVTFPDGTYYGRLSPADLGSFVSAQELGQLHLDNLRGRCCYDPVTQAAEHFLRQNTGVLERTAYQLSDQQRLDELHWAVSFAAAAKEHRLVLAREVSAAERVVSCSPRKTEPVVHFRLVQHEVTKPGPLAQY